MKKFKRTINKNDSSIRYDPNDIKQSVDAINNCHFGTMKLFYSELEFLMNCNKYIDINECLLLYIGAQPGYRLKHLFIKEYFPKIKMLLYDPLKFDITEDESIIIKTGKDGFFDDDKVSEVIKIAAGRKILYMSDIRISDENFYKKEKLIYEDMIKQQKWAVLMGAEFILLKFRTFFYQRTPEEIDFIDNTNVYDISDKVIYKKTEKFHDISNWLLYLSGEIYTQILAGFRSTEVRLFVKKIKYHKKFDKIVEFVNANMSGKHTKEEIGEKYLMKYYSSIDFEGKMNYFNIVTRQAKYSGKYKIYNYVIGFENDYTTKTITYLTLKWMKLNGKEINLKTLVEQIIKTLTFFYRRYNNNFIICATIKKLNTYYQNNNNKINNFTDIQNEKYIMKIKNIKLLLNEKINNWNNQIKNIMSLSIDKKIIDDYIKSHNIPKNKYFYFENKMFIMRKHF